VPLADLKYKSSLGWFATAREGAKH